MSVRTTEPVGRARRAASPHPGRSQRSHRLAALTLAAWDALACIALFALTGMVAGSGLSDDASAAATPVLGLAPLLMAALAVVSLAVLGDYGKTPIHRGHLLPWSGGALVVALATAWITLLVAAAVASAPDLTQLALVSVALPLAWLPARVALRAARARRRERVLVLGSGAVAQQVVALAERNRHLGVAVVGFLDDFPLPLDEDAPPVLGGLEDLDDVLERERIDRVIVAFSPSNDSEVLAVLRRCDRHGVHLDIVPRLFDLVGEVATVRSFGGLALLGIQGRTAGPAQLAVKRSIDVALAVAGLMVLAPTLAVIALAIRMEGSGPVVFRQERVGRFGKAFEILKFRTMAVESDDEAAARIASWAESQVMEAEGSAVEMERLVSDLKARGAARTTRVGDVLRRSSLDEALQLWNVLRGDMSIVGPRPLRSFEVATLEGWQRTRQEVRPGITGLWQVSGRSHISWRERMQFDYSYVRHWSVALDLKIILRTVSAVLGRRGAY